jgi:integrase
MGRGKRGFGSVRRLSSGRYQARYTAPDGLRYEARTAQGGPLTFDTRGDADAWLSLRHSEILRVAWLPPKADPATMVAPDTLREYADRWLAGRDLAERTREHYRQLLDDHIYPTFGASAVASISPSAVRAWFATLARADGRKVKDRPTTRAHAYGLLRTIMNTAVADELVAANPCRVRGGGQVKRKVKIRPATLDELSALVAAMPERYRLMVTLAAWCALRFGELAELRRRDIDVRTGVIRVRRGMVRAEGVPLVKGPKSDAGRRDVAIPPHLMPMVREHLRAHVAIGADALLFPATGGGHMHPSSLATVFYPARVAVGRSDLRFHDLRHTGATLAAATGATLAELMARLGHSTAAAAMRYQHAAADRDRVIADALSALATAGTVTPITSATKSVRAKRSG